jgi:hypothetical protein
MNRYIDGEDQTRFTFLPECLDDYRALDNPAREPQRSKKMTWLRRRTRPDCTTIAGFHRDNGRAIRDEGCQSIVLCRLLDLLSRSIAALDGSRLKTISHRDGELTDGKVRA